MIKILKQKEEEGRLVFWSGEANWARKIWKIKKEEFLY